MGIPITANATRRRGLRSQERLIDLIRKHSHEEDHQIIGVVLDAVRSWTCQPELQDDMTLLLAREVQKT